MTNFNFNPRTLVLAACLALASMAIADPKDKVSGTGTFSVGGVEKTLKINVEEQEKKGATGTIFYKDTQNGSFTAVVTTVNVQGDTAYIAARIDKSSSSAWVGRWIFIKLVEGEKPKDPDTLWIGLVGVDASVKGVLEMLDPADGPFLITNGDFKINGK